ncbi:MAG TPA: hypothetical protein VF608_14720 [Thermoanaerobaculia bacterium]
MKRSLATLFLLIATTTLFAREKNNADALRRFDAAVAQESVTQLLYALPSTIDPQSDLIELRIVQGNVALISETVALPFDGRKNASLSVLRTHADELKRLRSIEAENAGSLRFIASVDGRVITDAPFAMMDELRAAMSIGSIIGETRSVNSRPAAKLRAQSQAWEPSCVANCEAQYSQCLEWCDPRGSECSQCYEWYNDCLYSCPQVCSEPKSVTTYNVRVPQSSTLVTTSCLKQGTSAPTRWERRSVVSIVYTYQRTEHCNGSYTDVLTGSTYDTQLCWYYTATPCSPSQGLAPLFSGCP